MNFLFWSTLLGAKRHDSINFLFAWNAYRHHCYELLPSNVCPDSAHDTMPTYRLLEYMGINALVDINSHNKACGDLPSDITLDTKGHPHCKAGSQMYRWEYERNKDADKYRYPCKCGSSGICDCPCMDECSKSRYGRTVYIRRKNNLHFHPRIPRDSAEYASIYSKRTACEHVNNRVLNDYHLLELVIHGDDHYSF